jgi:DNA-binding XRE family transcriptional regulator
VGRRQADNDEGTVATPLTRDFKATVQARIARDPKYRNELLHEDAELARERPVRKRAITVPIDPWLNRLVRQSPAFEAIVAGELAAIRVVQDLVALRESRGLSQAQLARRVGVTRSAIAQLESAQPGNIELRTLVRVAAALGAHVDLSIRPSRRPERQPRQAARPTATKPS